MRVAVIGGGIAGLSAAARLAQHAEVTVFEAEAHLGYHTSGRSAAMYEENYGNAAVRALNRASKDWFETSGVLSPRGIMLVALEAEISLFETDLADMGMEERSLAENQYYTTWMTKYSLKFNGCHSVPQFEREEGMRSVLIAKFKLCPSDSCEKCNSNYGEYIVEMR